MPKNVETQRPQNQPDPKQVEVLIKQAVEVYNNEQTKPTSAHKGLCKVCEEVSDQHFAAILQCVDLKWTTVRNRVNDMQSCQEEASSRSWITPEESDQLIQ